MYFSDKFKRQRPPVLTVYATKTSLTLTVVVLIARLVAARAKAAAVTLIARAANALSSAWILNLELAVSYLEIGSPFLRVLTNWIYVVPTCDDGEQNQGETAIDCGGDNGCPRCREFISCEVDADCVSGICDIVESSPTAEEVPWAKRSTLRDSIAYECSK